MAFSKPDDQESILQKSVAAAIDACRWMETELGAARKIAADAMNASRRALRDRKISEPLEQRQLAADLRVSNLAAELVQAKINLSELEKELADCRKAKQCEADAAEYDKRIAAFADKGTVAIKAIVEWAETMPPLDSPDMLGTFIFFSNVAAESPSTRDMHLVLARNRRNAIAAGAATLSRSASVQAYTPPLPAPTVQVTALKPVAWMADGIVRKAAAGMDIDLPPATAKHAVKIGAVCTMADPRRRAIKESGTLKIGTPLFRNCVQLNDGMVDPDPEPFREPVLRSVPPNTVDPQFTPIPPSQLPPPRVMQVARNDTDLIARNNAKNNRED